MGTTSRLSTRSIRTVAATLAAAVFVMVLSAGFATSQPTAMAAQLNYQTQLVASAQVDPNTTCTITIVQNESEHIDNFLRIIDDNGIVQDIPSIEGPGTAFTTQTFDFTGSGSIEIWVHYTYRTSITGDILNCSTPTPTPTPTPIPTATPAPTPTPIPTATPAPTPTPIPTATPAPTATPIPTVQPTPVATAGPATTTTATPTATAIPTATPTTLSVFVLSSTPTPVPSPSPTPEAPPQDDEVLSVLAFSGNDALLTAIGIGLLAVGSTALVAARVRRQDETS